MIFTIRLGGKSIIASPLAVIILSFYSIEFKPYPVSYLLLSSSKSEVSVEARSCQELDMSYENTI